MNFKNAKIKILDLDLKGCIYLNHFSHSVRIRYMLKVISRLGDGVFWYFMLMMVWLSKGIAYSLQMFYLIMGFLFGTVIYKILKTKTVRPRPYQVHQVIRLGERPLDHFSFPSGHTLHAVMVSTILGFIEPILLILMLPFTLLVAISRVILGLHYPSDVLVGAILGGVIAIMLLHMAPILKIAL